MKRSTYIPGSPLPATRQINARHVIAGALMGTTALISVPAAIAQEAGAHSVPAAMSRTALTTVDANITQTRPMLNAGLAHGGFQAIPGKPVTFKTYWNYDSSINWGAIRIFKASDPFMDSPVASLAVSKEAPTVWTPAKGDAGEYFYVLRVYDMSGRYDETKPRPLILGAQAGAADKIAPTSASIFRQDNTAVRNINIRGLSTPQVHTRITTDTRIAAPAQPKVRYPVQATPKPTPPTHKPASQVQEAARPVLAPPLAAPETSAPVRSARPAFDVYIDGERPRGVSDEVDLRHSADAALNKADIRMSYDGLHAAPLLNAGLADGSGTARPGETLKFATYWNYNSWISRAEILIYDPEDSFMTAPIAVMPVQLDGSVEWTVPAARTTDVYTYVLRAYNEAGEYDETNEKLIRVSARPDRTPQQVSQIPPIYGFDNTATRNIQIDGGTVTVSGKGMIADGTSNVTVFGHPVRLDQNGDFAVQQIVPAGQHKVDVSYTNADGTRLDITREIDIPEDDWFLVALGDLTIGTQTTDARAIIEASGEEFDDVYVRGRAAFYLKGKVQGKYLLTAAMDTTEENIEDLFSNLDKKTPQSLLRRINPDLYYPVYGDDSTYHEDAPTQGRFYVRLERGDDHIMWGNFLTNMVSTEFAQIDRGLYGARIAYNSDETTQSGERRARVQVFAAEPGTLPSREEFRGTGGSVYFLENQDITIGSERLRVEVRDEESGLVIETQDLRPFVDYEIDYIQGRVLLARPLSSTRLGTEIVRDGTLSGRSVYLVARYEHTPTFTDINGYTLGGRAEGWISDGVRLGVTAQSDESGDIDQTLMGADIVLRADEETYLKAEVSQTDGPGFTERASLDGGFNYDTLQSGPAGDANAYRLEAAAALERLSDYKGRVAAYYENLEAGFSAPGRQTLAETTRVGASLNAVLSEDERDTMALKIDSASIEGGLEDATASADVHIAMTEHFVGGLGLRYSDVSGSAVGRNGTRTDIGAELKYEFDPNRSVYVFGQGTLGHTGNRPTSERLGLGGEFDLTETLGAKAEISDGKGGTGALGELTWTREDGDEYYLSYTLDAERTEPGVDGINFGQQGQNTLTGGARKRFSSWLSVYGEERASFGDMSGLTHAYGLDITPTEHLVLGGSFEVGNVNEKERLIEREAYTASVGFSDENVHAGVALEVRQDREDTLGVVASRDTWLLRTNVSVQATENWRALAKFNKAESNASEGAFFDGEFTEAQIGAAYRPTYDNRLNGLVRFTYYEDLPPATQINRGASELPAQKSNIFSIDANYKLTDWLTLGGKYGYRFGEVSLLRERDDFIDSTAQLGVIRADIHVVKKWDALIETRILDVDTAQDSQAGVLAAIYRHVGDNAKVGIGYNFTDFSDDLTDLSYDDSGLFLNMIAKF